MRLRTVVYSLTAALLSACGGGGGGGGGSGNPQTGLEELVPTDVAVIYVTSTLQAGGSADEVVTTITQFVPQTGESVLIDINQSFSFARSNASIFTYDDRLLLLRNAGTSGGSGGDWRLLDTDAEVDKSSGRELQPALLNLSTSQGTPTPYCVATDGASLYWRNAGGALVSIGLSGAPAEAELFAAGNASVCFGQVFTIDGLGRTIGGLDFADGVFYDVAYDDSTGQMDFYTRNTATAAPSLITSLAPADHAAYNPGYSISFDDGQAFFARVDAGNGQLEIWSFDFVNQPQLLLASTQPGLASVSGLDVDDGRFVVRLLEQGANGFNSTRILLFDNIGMTTSVVDLLDINPATPGLLPPTFDDVRILFRQP